ncbi:MAG: Holliday junction ATP-dependent DNA helicase RuvB [Phycisphaerae bacterium]|nr:Holliday junction ATP-dependent DNA helicase RuvB [Phycisphaerae bacterium]
MSYTVLARKYRSQTFDEIVGQAAIASTLVNAIRADRIHHGYLFTGTRGVGKTSTARILAKALNCLKAERPTPAPCGACDACVSIAEGQDIDVLEIDAASNTGVDNIRELRSNASLRPARSRFRIYIIDEVHMLSTGAFNALLKTLEEPPAHVKFILATTEIQKVPATIQSRCQRFTFRNIGPEDIAAQLERISSQEGATAEPAAIRRIARLANGSMRDALSILDQLLSLSPSQVTVALLDEVLPPAHNEEILALLKRAAEGDAAGVLKAFDGIMSRGRALETACNDAIDVLRSLMHLRACGPSADWVEVPAAARDEYVALAGAFELSHYVQMIGLLEELRRNAHFSAAGRALADACMVRIARLKQWSSIESLLEQAATEDGAPAAAGASKKNAPTTPQPAVARRSVLGEPPAAVSTGFSRNESGGGAVPGSLVESAPAGGAPTPSSGHSLLSPAVSATASREPVLEEAISADERSRIMKDPVVRQALELFDGHVVNIERRGGPQTAEPKE